MTKVAVLAAVMIGVTVFGCEKKEEVAVAPAGGAAAAAPAGDVLPEGLVLAAAPAGAKDVKDVRAAAKAGDEVVVRGVVAGRKDPVAENRAIVTLLDSSIKTCDQTPGDTCKTPWDACCEPADSIAAHSATVEVVGADGRPLKAGLATAGVKPLKSVTVVGTYKPSADGKAVTVEAKGIYVAP